MGLVNKGPDDAIRVAFHPAFCGSADGVGGDLESPASEIFAVEQTFEARFDLEVIGFGFNESERSEYRTEGGGPAAVAGIVGVQQVRHVLRLCVTIGAGEGRPGIEYSDLGIATSDALVQQIDVFDTFGRAFFGSRAGEHKAEHNRGFGAGFGDLCEDELYVGSDHVGRGAFFEVVGASKYDDGFGFECEYVIFESEQHAAGRIAADASISDFQAREKTQKVVVCTLCDGITEEHNGVLVGLLLFAEASATFFPQIAEPVIAANGASAG